MKKSMHRRRRRPASASTTNETLDRVSGIIARRKKDAAAAAAPRRGPLFNSDAFSSHNARVQAWQPRFQSPSGSRSALRDIRKRKQALLEAEERHKRDCDVLSKALQRQCAESQQLRVTGLLAVRKAATEAAEKTRVLLSVQQQRDVELLERKRARDVRMVERRRATAEQTVKATREKLETTREELETALKQKRERTVSDSKELAQLVTSSASASALARVTIKSKEDSLEASHAAMAQMKEYAAGINAELSRLQNEREAEKKTMKLALQASEARCAAAEAETEKVRREIDQAARDWMAQVKAEYDNNLREVKRRHVDAHRRLESRLARAEKNLLARTAVTSALVDGVMSSAQNIHQKATVAFNEEKKKHAEATAAAGAATSAAAATATATATAAAVAEQPLPPVVIDLRIVTDNTHRDDAHSNESMDASELIAADSAKRNANDPSITTTTITESNATSGNNDTSSEETTATTTTRGNPLTDIKSPTAQVGLLQIKLDEARAELATYRRTSSRRIETLQNTHAREMFTQLSQHNESLSRAISSGARALALAKQDHESQVKALHQTYRSDLADEQFKRQVAEIRADKKAALLVLQRCWRGALARSAIFRLARRARDLETMDGPRRLAAESVQRAWRGRLGRLRFERKRHKRQYKNIHNGQKRIARGWREHKEYRDTIGQKRAVAHARKGRKNRRHPKKKNNKNISSNNNKNKNENKRRPLEKKNGSGLWQSLEVKEDDSLTPTSVTGKSASSPGSSTPYASPPINTSTSELMRFVHEGNLAKIETLVNQDGSLVHWRDDGGKTALFYARIPGMVDFLSARGADLNASDHDGMTPLTHAILQERENVCRLLIMLGAEVRTAGAQLEGPCGDGASPLHCAAHVLNDDIVRVLLASGADPNSVARSYGWTPLFEAVHAGIGQVVAKEILAAQAQHDQNGDVQHGVAGDPATVSARAVSIVELLLHHGGRPDTHDGRGNTPLVLAVRNRNRAIVRLLLEHGATPGVPGVQLGKDGTETFDMLAQEKLSPLYASVLLEEPELVSLLLSFGADPDVHSNHGLVPLHIAAKLGNIEIAKMLLDAHCDLSAVDSHSNSALHISLTNGHALFSHTLLRWNRELIETLAKTGSTRRISMRLTHRNDDGDTAFDVATKVGLGRIFDADYDLALEDEAGRKDMEEDYVPVRRRGREVAAEDETETVEEENNDNVRISDESSISSNGSGSSDDGEAVIVGSTNIDELLVLPDYTPVPDKILGGKKVSWGAKTFGDEKEDGKTAVVVNSGDSVQYGERVHNTLESSIAAVQKAAAEGLEHYYEDPEWVTFMDPSSGCPYYYNTITQVTQWELPEEILQ